jgi:hypothetical protein
MIDNTLMLKSHIEMITLKLNVACFVVRAIKTFVMLDTLMVKHSYFHSIINYEIIFCSNSIFILQNRIIGIIMRVGIKDSCREFIKILIIFH